jgi:hypothetical protein
MLNARCAAIGEKTTPIVAEAEFAFLTGLPIVCSTQIRLGYIVDLLFLQRREQDAAALYDQGVALGECRKLPANTMVRKTNLGGPNMSCVLNPDDPPEAYCFWVSNRALTTLSQLLMWGQESPTLLLAG